MTADPYVVPNGLCQLSDVQAALRMPSTDSVDTDRINLAIDAASRAIEVKCNRRFYLDAEPSPRRFVCNDPWLVEVDDIGSTEGLALATDEAGDQSFSTIWDVTQDIQTEPVNGIMQGQPGWPISRIRAVRSLYFPIWGGIAYPRPYTQALVQVTAVWGWAAVPAAVVKAAVVQSVSLFKADDAPFGATPFAEAGIVRMKTALHPTAELLLEPYCEEPVLIG